MSGILVVAEARRGELRDITLELISAAREIKGQVGGGITVAVVEADAGSLIEPLSVDGVDEIVTVTSPVATFEPMVAARALESLVASERPSVVLLGHTVDAMSFAPAVALKAGLGFASGVSRLAWSDGPLVTRLAYGGKLEAQLDFPGKSTTLLMLQPAAFPKATGAGAPAVRPVEIAFPTPATEHVRYEQAGAAEVDIAKADFLLAVGRGVGEQDNIARFQELAERFGATLVVSRPLVDSGWMSNAFQVGQSGQTVKPRVYLALGISGAVQHLAGMRDAETIIAVNTDPDAPIFGVAHYGAACDMFELADELEHLLA